MGIFRLPDGAPADATSRACSTQISSSQIDEKRRAVITYKYIDISSMRADVMGLFYSPSLNTLIHSFGHDNANYHVLLFRKPSSDQKQRHSFSEHGKLAKEGS